MDLYEKRLFLDENPYQVYINLSQFNEIYRKITGRLYLDEDGYKNKYPNLFKEISKIENNKIIEIASNCFDFYDYCNYKLPHTLSNTIDLLESINKPFDSFKDINGSDIKPLIRDYFDYIHFENKDLFDYFYKNNYIINLDILSNDIFGTIYFDFLGKEDYIFVKVKDRCNLEITSTNIHEFGHEDDVRNLDMKTKYKYVLLSPYIEVPSYLIQNKFYDYLIDENINNDFARIAKYKLIEDSIYKLSNCITFFDSFSKGDVRHDINISEFIKYGFGKFVSVCVLNDKESLDIFKEFHYNIFNASLLDKLDINEDKCNKIFCKEIDKIYK